MGAYYWWLEFFKVLFAYLILVFVFPSVLFRTYLRGKSRTFWFGLCVTSSMLLISTAVILLGLVHLLNVWVVRILFYGSFILSLSRSMHMPMTVRYLVYKVQNRTYGWKLLVSQIWNSMRSTMGRGLAGLWRLLQKNFLEVLLLLGLVVYGVLYFSWNPIHTPGYGFSDIIVHHNWANGLAQGTVFVSGIYPEAMHCMAYAVSTLFGIELYSAILYIQCANIMTFLVSVYLFGREIGGWKGSALLMLTAFLTIKLDSITQIYIMSRLQCALPQEYGLFTVFLIPTFLMRYLKNASHLEFRGKKTKFYWDENLLIFTLAIAASISIHFYTTIMAVFSCMGVIVVWFFKIFHWRRFVPLAVAAVMAVFLSFGPMLLAFATGIPFQGSIFWALSVMKPTEETDTVDQSQIPDYIETENSIQQTVPTTQVQIEKPKVDMGTMIANLKKTVTKRIDDVVQGINVSYRSLYQEGDIQVFVGISKVAVCLALGYRLLMAILRRLFPKIRCSMEQFDGYAIVVVITLVFMMAFSPGRVGIPALIQPDRVCSVAHVFLMCLLVLPIDFAGVLIAPFLNRKMMSLVGAGALVVLIFLVVNGGYYHSYLYTCGTRHNAAVNVTNSIIKDIPKEEFAIVSTTDELYQLIDYGFHEEIITILDNAQGQEYYIPSRYIFFYLEKHPIMYGHTHFSDGPSWLALQNYADKFADSSEGGHMTGGEISREKAEKEIAASKLSDTYTTLENREIIESRFALYLEFILRQYPIEINVYYEDEDFICYCLEQNPNRLFNLSVNGY